MLDACVAADVRKFVFASSGGTIYGPQDDLPGQGDGDRTTDVAVRHHEARGRGLPPVLPRRVRAGLHVARARQRLRSAPGSARRGRSHRDLRDRSSYAASSRRSTGSGDQTRDFVFVEDVAHAFVRAIEHGSGETMNIATGMETTINELYDAMAERCEVRRTPRTAAPPGRVTSFRNALDPSQGGEGPRLEAVDARSTTGLRKTIDLVPSGTKISAEQVHVRRANGVVHRPVPGVQG